MSTELFRFRLGAGPLVVSCPHPGTKVPAELSARMSESGLGLPDTDWHVDKLYDFLAEFGATFLVAEMSRYVVDLNRNRGALLYPGKFETGVCPLQTFAGQAIYRQGEEPGETEIAERIERYWRPYHFQLAEALAATKKRHGFAILLDAHSILSGLPRLFEGKLPDLNLGTNGGLSCAPDVERLATDALRGQPTFTFVLNGRFKGGYITRHYGRPAEHIHAMQLEIACSAYLDEANPSLFDPARAAPLRRHLREFVAVLMRAHSRRHPA